MNMIKKILLGLGALSVSLVLLIVVVSQTPANFKSDNELFIQDFMSKLTASWNVQDVVAMTSNEFMEQVITPEGRHYFKLFSAMGEIKSITDMELADMEMNTALNKGLFIFKANFEKGDALVKLLLFESEGESRIQALDIIPVQSGEIQTASLVGQYL